MIHSQVTRSAISGKYFRYLKEMELKSRAYISLIYRKPSVMLGDLKNIQASMVRQNVISISEMSFNRAKGWES